MVLERSDWDEGLTELNIQARDRLVEAGIVERLRDLGHDVRRTDVELATGNAGHAHAPYALAYDIANAVRRARDEF